MKLGRIIIFEDGKCTLEIKNGLFEKWEFVDGFDDIKTANEYAKNEHCIFIFVKREND